MVSIRKRGKAYQLDWRDGNGKRHRPSVGKVAKSVALAALTQKKLDLIGNPTASVPVETVEEFSKKYLDWYTVQYPSSIERVANIFKKHIIPEFGAKPLNMVTPYETNTWVIKLTVTLAPGSTAKVLKALKAMFNRAVEWQVITHSPIAGKTVRSPKDKSDKDPDYYLAPQLAALYAKCNERNHWMWKFIANTGLRRQEALNLQHTHMFATRIHVESTNESPTKGATSRDVPLNSAAKLAYKHLVELVGDPIFVFPRMFPSSMSRLFKADLKRAGLRGSIKALRHSFGANLTMSGVPLRTVQVLMGHASIQTTEIYAHLAPGYMAKITTKINL